MFAYVNIYKPKSFDLEMDRFNQAMAYRCWGTIENPHSPVDVVMNPKKYKHDMDRIKKADLSYPIIVSDVYIIDGYHRIAKAYLEKKKTIKAYWITDELMKQFIVCAKKDMNKLVGISAYHEIELFYKRFCGKPESDKWIKKFPVVKKGGIGTNSNVTDHQFKHGKSLPDVPR